MSRKKLKQHAQERILQSAMEGYGSLKRTISLNADENQETMDQYFIEMRKQIARIEKLFGYEPNSFTH